MASDLIHLMKAFFLPAAGNLKEETWQPSTDVYQTSEGWLVKFDLAGIPPEEVSLETRGPHLTIQGRRRDWCLAEGCHYQMMEIAYSQFERTVVFPEDLERTRITTEYRLGFLLVRLQKETDQ